MKNTATTEAEMRTSKAPTPDTLEELTEYVQSLTDLNHDYGTCVYAMSMAAVAAFNHVASKLGVTGFQASCADLDILRRTRGMEGPFIILKAEDECYPQYDISAKLKEAREEWKQWVSKECKKKLEDHGDTCRPDVKAHWEMKASEYVEAPNTKKLAIGA